MREIFDQSIRKNEIIKLLRVIEPVDQAEKFIQSLAQKFGIFLASPENEICKQGEDDGKGMYFIQLGECSVFVQDKVGLESGVKEVRKLTAGDHFGVRMPK